MIQSDENQGNKQNLIFLLIGVLAISAALVYFLNSDEETLLAPESVNEETVQIPQTEGIAETDSLKEQANPEFDLVRISRGGTGVIAGRVSAGAIVELYANGEKVSEVTADDNGEWVLILEEPLESGSVELNLKSQRSDGKQTEASNVVVVSVPERDSQRFIEQQENGVVAVLSPKDGSGPSRILQRPGIGAFSEVGDSLAIETVDYGEGSLPIVSGTALPRVDVRLYVNDKFVDAVKTNDNGEWAISITEDVDFLNNVTLRVDQTVAEGKVLLRVVQPFTINTPLDPSAATGGVIIRPGNTLWQIARQLYGSGVRYTVIFKENSELIEDPDIIYPGQVFKLPRKQ